MRLDEVRLWREKKNHPKVVCNLARYCYFFIKSKSYTLLLILPNEELSYV